MAVRMTNGLCCELLTAPNLVDLHWRQAFGQKELPARWEPFHSDSDLLTILEP